MLAGFIDSWKNRGLSPKDVPAGEAAVFANGKGGKLYAAYQERLKALNAVDFGDLLLHCLTLFRDYPDVLQTYHDRFRYILVDEYQDTNTAQYLWLRLLAQGRRNICCVGDDDLWLARRRGRQHPALRARFSGRDRDPAGAQLPLDRPYPRHRLEADRPQ
jgi:DNA helicase-2/ATP-dependent DNA helicase PcrA